MNGRREGERRKTGRRKGGVGGVKEGGLGAGASVSNNICYLR